MYYDKNNIYISSDKRVLYDLDKYDIYILDDETFEIFNSIYNNENLKEYDSSKYNEILVAFFNKNTHANMEIPNNIKHLKIHTSNVCNLKCKYCYANHGNYGNEDSVMLKETAIKISSIIKKQFANVETIAFLGGEPLLAIDAIEEICKNVGKDHVRYLLETNLTNLDDKIINVINEYDIKLTVSIDGPKEINDANRIFKNGTGTYDTISSNIETLKKRTNSFVAIQATYTLPSYNKYTKREISKYLYDKFKATDILVEDVETNDQTLKLPANPSDLNEAREDVKFLFETILSGKYNFENDFTPILHSLFSKNYTDCLCHAGLESMTIEVSGNMWPCQLYINNSNYYMGNIISSGDNLDNCKEFNMVRNVLGEMCKSKTPRCNNCIAKYWCSVCIGSSVLANEDINNERWCIRRKNLTALCLDELSFYVQNNSLNMIINKIKEIALQNSLYK